MNQNISDNIKTEEKVKAVSGDIYSIIKSAEIREYFRKENCMGIFEKEQLVLHGYISLRQKADLLKQLSRSGQKEENRKVEEMYRIYADYMNLIIHPPVRTVFLLELVSQWWEKDHVEEESSLTGAFDTLDEVTGELEEMRDFIKSCHKTNLYGNVTVLQIPQEEKVKEAFHFTMFLIDGNWQIKDLDIADAELKAWGAGKDTVRRFNEVSSCLPLPFQDGDRIKLRLPCMEAPFYGVLRSEKDKTGCWYHWLNDRTINLSCSEIGLTSGYSTFDWIERA